MFIPLHDGVPLRFMRAPFVTHALIALCTGLYLLVTLRRDETAQIAVAAGFGLIPSVLFGTAQLPTELLQAPPWLTPLSNVVLHLGLAHLLGNMLFLFVFGDNVEDAMGHARFLLFFGLCGLGGSLTHAMMNPASEQPLIGASGAISGVIAAYLMLYPRVRIWGLAFNWIPLRITALYAIVAWILFQFLQALIDPDGPVGWWAHLGGLGTGAALTPLLIHRRMALFGRAARG
ncbi:MAG TPA: rhomboid family intramembrane serine protease [Bosea sp. (in: a-proteobacteria)]|uniref:rhomboid family intramembrane serine protease n=1 Tax=Bosea sp. (in: a-proteobacteria) TaxID=1871050 RepID=UPI002DDD2E9A|nr:rhomboid family intramembrane serine protease [Bosea sp. (in: a-proteobacteria)]HEV2554988.1 rhomboid family intramembrane serine protease [Bosea sp. (in: a-proteobacteria)]